MPGQDEAVEKATTHLRLLLVDASPSGVLWSSTPTGCPGFQGGGES
jgi:hypothetical protein